MQNEKRRLSSIINKRIQAHISNTVLIILACSSVVMLVLSVFRAKATGEFSPLVVYSICSVLLVIAMLTRHRVSTSTKVAIITVISIVVVLRSQWQYGIFSPSNVLVIILIAYILYFLKLRYAILLAFALLLGVSVIGLMYITGTIHIDISTVNAYVHSIAAWLILISVLAFSLIYLIFMQQFSHRLTHALLKHLENKNMILLKKNRELNYAVAHDTLTDCYNRHAFLMYLDKCMLQKEKNDYLIIIDILEFKKINDIYGHSTGDKVLCAVANTLQTLFQTFVFRVGGNEFACIKFLSNKDELSLFSQQLDKVYEIKNKKLYLRFIIGATKLEYTKTSSYNLGAANLALSTTKSRKLPYVLFSRQLGKEQSRVEKIEEAVSIALKQDEFYLVYQPLVDAIDDYIIGCEVLIRWEHSKLGLIRPDEFIPLIEKLGEADKLNEYVVGKALSELNTFLVNLTHPFKLSINISPVVYSFSAHMEKLIAYIDEQKFPKLLEINFEITESQFMQHLSQDQYMRTICTQLKLHNISLSIDDFGTDYSSLNRFLRFQFNTIKIDRSFIQKLDEEDNKPFISAIKSIVLLANELNINLVAEGAETKAQVEKLVELGCTIIQGYYYYKPMSAKELINQLAKSINSE